MSLRPALLVLVLIVGCRGPAGPTAPATGSLSGMIRAAATGEGVPGTRVVLRRPGSVAPEATVADSDGAYMVGDLPPGRYAVSAYASETRIAEREVAIVAGRITGLDFAVGAVGAEADRDLNAPSAAPLWRYRPVRADPGRGAIEGTVADLHHLERLAGAVVSIVRDGETAAEVVVTDDVGRFWVDGLVPGTYTVSAYYAVARVGQLEVLRNNVRVGGGEVVVVPLWLSTDGF